ncbi:CIA30 family protein [Mucilaginibacter segetis]|uniref:CIA30 family protein n=1 Tax=Mucilaginibacter segetis TaxID=2793071 RepID=A0A934PUT9_9SPHI|nr:CIA30 family protein [Mucilaginibacter segetis]MBK0379423.1 CIA30 family protein [Mucilaginibacter segetis]
MKKIFLSLVVFCSVNLCFGQSSLISYDDITYLLHNNINKADTFFMSKGFTMVKKDVKKKTRKYGLSLPGHTYINIDLRTDGKRLFIDMETNEPQQYNLIYNSISQYINKEGNIADVQSFTVKDLGNIYITINDTMPYDPLKRLYDIHIISDKGITAYN